MKKTILFFVLLLLAFPLWGQKKSQEKAVLLAKLETTTQDFYAGDSVVVNVVLYSNLPFEEVVRSGKAITASGANIRLLPQYYAPTQQRVRNEQGMMYALLVERYMVHTEQLGELKLSPTTYEAQLGVYEESYDFFGWPTQVLRSKITKKVDLSSQKLQVKERPKRSTRQLLQQRANVA